MNDDVPSARQGVSSGIMFKNLTSDGLHAVLSRLGMSLRSCRQLHASVLRSDRFPDAMHDISAKVLDSVRQATSLPRLKLLHKAESMTDGFSKYLFQGDGQESFEAVRIPLLHRHGDMKYVVCVSSQVGCQLGCVFCATGRMGLTRNLSAWEIVDQVIQIQKDSQFPVRGVVFMGMGEPLLNYESVIEAAKIMSEPCGLAISGKAITISTAGIPQAIRRFTDEGHPFRIVFSLTKAVPAKRRLLMPVEETFPTSEVMAALRRHHEATRKRVILAWTMISGVNTTELDATELAELVGSLPVKIDLIDINDSSGRFHPPSQAELDIFRDALRSSLNAPVGRRYSGGGDIQAACGMLAGSRQS